MPTPDTTSVYQFTLQRAEHDHISVEAPNETTARLLAREHLLGLYGDKPSLEHLNLSTWSPQTTATGPARVLSTRINETQARRVRFNTLIRAAEELEGGGTQPMYAAAQELRQMATWYGDHNDDVPNPNPDRKRIVECPCGTRLVFRRHDNTARDMEHTLSCTRCPTCYKPLPDTCPTESEVVTARWTLALAAAWDTYDQRGDACLIAARMEVELTIKKPQNLRPGKDATNVACAVIGRLAAYKLAYPHARVPA